MNKKGPFGIYMGMPLSEIDSNAEQLLMGRYQLKNVPKPHSAFDYYVVKATTQHGISMIKAIGKNIKTNVYGHQLQSAFKEMEDKLFSIYGKHETIDTLLPGSIWNEPKEWMDAFTKQERYLMAAWSNDRGSQMSDSVKAIVLAVEVFNTDTGCICVEYCFSNDDLNDSAIQAQEDDAL